MLIAMSCLLCACGGGENAEPQLPPSEEAVTQVRACAPLGKQWRRDIDRDYQMRKK